MAAFKDFGNFGNRAVSGAARRAKAFLNSRSSFGSGASGGEASLYLDLIKRSLTGRLSDEGELRRLDRPTSARTMIGRERLDNLQFCVERALDDRVPGDLIETGVWRGGSTIFMRAILKARDVTDRRVWVADSFEGLPPPDPEKFPEDDGDVLYTKKILSVSLEEVKNNFRRYGLLDGQVEFLKGWFRDTLPDAPVEKLAVARLDGDMYESTIDALVNLYPKLSPGGFLIVDDYGGIEACRKAVHDYRDRHGIKEEIIRIDWNGVYWRRDK